MSDLTIASWNSQGNPTCNRKVAYLRYLLESFDVVLLQEGGNPKTVNFELYPPDGLHAEDHYWASERGKTATYLRANGTAIGAFNERCTNYILARGPAPSRERLPFEEVDLTHVVGGGDAGRTPAAASLGSTIFISWHSIASGDNSDTRTLIRASEEELVKKDSRTNRIVIGGDFNTRPSSIEGVLDRHFSERKADKEVSVKVVSPLTRTQKSDRPYPIDFFVIMTRRTSVHRNYECRVGSDWVSDHLAVATAVPWSAGDSWNARHSKVPWLK